jgi:hypothetical protein
MLAQPPRNRVNAPNSGPRRLNPIEDINDTDKFEDQQYDKYDADHTEGAATRREPFEILCQQHKFSIIQRSRSRARVRRVNTMSAECLLHFCASEYGVNAIKRGTSIRKVEVLFRRDNASVCKCLYGHEGNRANYGTDKPRKSLACHMASWSEMLQ